MQRSYVVAGAAVCALAILSGCNRYRQPYGGGGGYGLGYGDGCGSCAPAYAEMPPYGNKPSLASGSTTVVPAAPRGSGTVVVPETASAGGSSRYDAP